MEEWKSRKIENMEGIEKWEDRRDLVFSCLCLVGGWKSGEIKKLICLIEKKNEMIKNEVGPNLQLYHIFY